MLDTRALCGETGSSLSDHQAPRSLAALNDFVQGWEDDDAGYGFVFVFESIMVL